MWANAIVNAATIAIQAEDVAGANRHERYRLIVDRYLVGLQVFALVREDLIDHVADVRTGAVRCGALGAGNKGAIAVSFSLFSGSNSNHIEAE